MECDLCQNELTSRCRYVLNCIYKNGTEATETVCLECVDAMKTDDEWELLATVTETTGGKITSLQLTYKQI